MTSPSSARPPKRFQALEQTDFQRLEHAGYLKGLLQPFKGKGSLEAWANQCMALRDSLIELAQRRLLPQARAYALVLAEPMPDDMNSLKVGDMSISEWVESARPFIVDAARRGSLMVIYSPLLRAIATDLESKLATSRSAGQTTRVLVLRVVHCLSSWDTTRRTTQSTCYGGQRTSNPTASSPASAGTGSSDGIQLESLPGTNV